VKTCRRVAIGFFALAQIAFAAERPSNTIELENQSSASIPAHTISISRPFAQGEVARCPSAFLNGSQLESQSDVKNRWPDGSVKFAIVSFVAPAVAAHRSVEIRFTSAECNSEKSTEADAVKALLGDSADFDAGIIVTGSTEHRISARDLLQKGATAKLWLNGPLVLGLVVEDVSVSKASDIGIDSDRPLHAVFEIWFYPKDSRYEVGYSLENTWASSDPNRSARNLSYAFKLDIGNKSRKVVFQNPKFEHAAFTRWHKTLLSSSAPELTIDHNAQYLISTGALPHWNTDLKIAPQLVVSTFNKWKNTNHDIGGKDGQLGNYNVGMNDGGAADWIGLATTWDIVYLLTSNPLLKEMSIGNADLAGGMPYHFREADQGAGSGGFFDGPDHGKVSTLGRVVSVNARRQVTLSDLKENCTGTLTKDLIKTIAPSTSRWPTDFGHMPDIAYLPYLFSGRYYYLSELQYHAAFVVGSKLGCAGGDFARQGSLGLINENQVRGEAWAFRTLSYASFISPDGSPEKAYFEDKLLNNIVEFEGIHNLPSSDAKRSAAYLWGRDKSVRSQVRNPSPLYVWSDRGPEFIQPPLKQDGSLAGGASPWEENFLTCALGMARQFGYPTKSLLNYLAHRTFNTLLNPKVGNPLLIEAYRYPTKVAPGGKWLPDWSGFSSYYATLPTTWQKGGNIDHSYGFIAMSALSYLYDLSADGYKGKQAWEFMVANKPEQGRLATESPKWSVTPLER
jgi:hypothetical protein